MYTYIHTYIYTHIYRKSYHEAPGDSYTYDRIETATDDEIALYWQSMVF